MKQKPSFQFYQQDFLGSMDVQMMSVEEVGCYCLLLFNCYNNGGTLPNDHDKLKFLCRGNAIASKVLEKFYIDGEFLRHKRIDNEMREKKKYSKRQSENAKKRWENAKKQPMPPHSDGNAVASKWQCSSTSSSTSSSTANGGEEEKKYLRVLTKWFQGMSDVKKPSGLAKFFIDKYPIAIVKKSLEVGKPTSRSAFSDCCEFYLKDLKK